MLRQQLKRFVFLGTSATFIVSGAVIAASTQSEPDKVTNAIAIPSPIESPPTSENATAIDKALGEARQALSIMENTGSRGYSDLLGPLDRSLLKPNLFAKPLVSSESSRDHDKLMIFISSSMPKASVRRLADQAAACGAALVMRGPVAGNFTATAKYFSEALGVDKPDKRSSASPARAMIDPTLFDKFGINSVPAFVLAPGGICLGTRCDKASPEHARVNGDVTLDFALEHLIRTRPDFAVAAQTFLDKLKRTP